MNKKFFKAPLEIKSLDEGGSFEGYASAFGVRDSDGDVIVKGAFTDSIKRAEESGNYPKMLWQHNYTEIVGKFFHMHEDDYGLYVKGALILEVERAREAYALLKAGVLDAMSVGFNIPKTDEDAEFIGGGRVISKLDLWEISLVTWGANPAARISNVKSLKDFEGFLRDAGFSRKEATTIASHGYKAVISDQSDFDSDKQALESIQLLTSKFKGA